MIGMTTAFSRQDRSSGAARSVKFGLGPVKMRWYGRLVDLEGAGEHEELRDEAGQTGQCQRRQAGDQEGARQDGRHALPAAVVRNPLRPAPGDEEAREQEEPGRGEAVVDHVEGRTGTGGRLIEV